MRSGTDQYPRKKKGGGKAIIEITQKKQGGRAEAGDFRPADG
jgi:hypothetical protein